MLTKNSDEFHFHFECCSDPLAGVKLSRINQSKAIGRAIHNVFFFSSFSEWDFKVEEAVHFFKIYPLLSITARFKYKDSS